MPDQDDKNSGHTSLPRQYERDKKEVEQIEDGHKESFKGVNGREAKAARNQEEDGNDAAKNVPATNQG